MTLANSCREPSYVQLHARTEEESSGQIKERIEKSDGTRIYNLLFCASAHQDASIDLLFRGIVSYYVVSYFDVIFGDFFF